MNIEELKKICDAADKDKLIAGEYTAQFYFIKQFTPGFVLQLLNRIEKLGKCVEFLSYNGCSDCAEIAKEALEADVC